MFETDRWSEDFVTPLGGLDSLEWSVDEAGVTPALELQVTDLGPSDAGWRVVHAVPFGSRRAFIEHVVLGPGGVFTVGTKTHPDSSVWVVGNTIKVNGDSERYVHRARHEAQVVGDVLTQACGRAVPVRGVVAVICPADRFTVKRQPDDVVVVAHRHLRQFFAAQPVVLTAAEVQAVAQVARRSTIWTDLD